ncbi:hypothetical protein N8I77_012134 [Diaporthe amygdali]|uniref:Ankyrin repeat protein n=1 Tax=Phomopsis amygdali TaxID=1214568 RepID=A0AAD9S446_PHOAM|nr:hypothetical protein N8I77_012134 [Diaporthe amygdali]
MPDPLTAIGSASAIVQLIGSLSSGLRTLRDAVAAIKDAPRIVKRMEVKIEHLGRSIRLLEQYFQQRPSKIPFETELYELIQEIAQSCISPLTIIYEKLPSRSAKNMNQAFTLWLNDNSITQATNHIDEYIPYLNLLVQTLNLFKADQTDELLRDIAGKLKQTARQRQPNQDAALHEVDRQALETTLKVRKFANSAATYVVQSVSATGTTSSRNIAPPRSGHTNSASKTSPIPSLPRSRRQLEYEWEQNRKDLEGLMGYHLFESAEKIQRRALYIKEELSSHHAVPFEQEERDEMEEQLADILIQCKTEGSTEQALSLLEKKINHEYSSDGAAQDLNLLALPSSSASRHRRLSLHSKLGRLYKDTCQMDRAEEHLRIAFDAYAIEDPRDVPKIQEVGEELLELHDYRVEFGDTEHRPVFISQLQGFKKELESVMGGPLVPRRTSCDKALEWCESEDIAVSKENEDPRFDILDEEGSSPLHHAAERCHDEAALQQMMENSYTLENPDDNGDTPLLIAAGCSNTTALSVLLQKGASVKARDRQYQTPLHRSQKPAVTKFLLQHRLRRASTMTIGLDDGRRFSSSSSSTFTTSPPNSIPDQDLDIDAQDSHKKTALYLACSQGRDRIVRLLLQAGANPNIPAHDHTPLAATIESQARSYIEYPKKKVEIVAALVSRGADPEAEKKLLRNAKGMQREILKALEGRSGSQLLQSKKSEDWSIDPRRDSGYQLSVSSSATKPQLDPPDFGPDWPPEFDKER